MNTHDAARLRRGMFREQARIRNAELAKAKAARKEEKAK